MRVIVCGGRDYHDVGNMFIKLDELHEQTRITELIEGGALGADIIAKTWAERRGVPCHTVHADWKNNGRAAGPMRNDDMLKMNPDLVIAFPGGVGTEDMKTKAKKAKVKVIVFE